MLQLLLINYYFFIKLFFIKLFFIYFIFLLYIYIMKKSYNNINPNLQNTSFKDFNIAWDNACKTSSNKNTYNNQIFKSDDLKNITYQTKFNQNTTGTGNSYPLTFDQKFSSYQYYDNEYHAFQRITPSMIDALANFLNQFYKNNAREGKYFNYTGKKLNKVNQSKFSAKGFKTIINRFYSSTNVIHLPRGVDYKMFYESSSGLGTSEYLIYPLKPIEHLGKFYIDFILPEVANLYFTSNYNNGSIKHTNTQPLQGPGQLTRQNRFNQRGGKKPTEKRHFRIVQLNGKNVSLGGVSISHKASPRDAAKKLLGSIAHEKGLKKNNKLKLKEKYVIQEYTQGSAKKMYGPYLAHYRKYSANEIKKASSADGKVKFTMEAIVKLVKNK